MEGNEMPLFSWDAEKKSQQNIPSSGYGLAFITLWVFSNALDKAFLFEV